MILITWRTVSIQSGTTLANLECTHAQTQTPEQFSLHGFFTIINSKWIRTQVFSHSQKQNKINKKVTLELRILHYDKTRGVEHSEINELLVQVFPSDPRQVVSQIPAGGRRSLTSAPAETDSCQREKQFLQFQLPIVLSDLFPDLCSTYSPSTTPSAELRLLQVHILSPPEGRTLSHSRAITWSLRESCGTSPHWTQLSPLTPKKREEF